MVIGRYLLIAVLCVPTVAQVPTFRGSPTDANTLDGAMKIASKLFPCPDAKWSLVEQTFWRHHTVLKLTSCQWPHRPTVAVDEHGYALLFTDNVLIISAKTPLAQFNTAAKTESTSVNARNVSDYLKFFVGSHLNWCDCLYFGGDSMAQKVRELWRESDAGRLAEQTNDLKAKLLPIGDLLVKDATDDHDFKAVVFEWRPDWTPPAMERHDITIHQDGTIELKSDWIWRDQPLWRDVAGLHLLQAIVSDRGCGGHRGFDVPSL